ncbi:MAG: 1,4-alpha-glucan branching protein GlgB [Puniceicoccales bacterium]|jgi:1,4-alpha-glucan branching enzyme|nr:1,4-alpha-glucan branching protein GlgB [Puniceicoccales bacterium]
MDRTEGSFSAIPDFDLHLFGEGKALRIHEFLGAHLHSRNGVEGVSFAVWAPNAQKVSVVGDFNGWNGLSHPMEPLGNSGVWGTFLTGLSPGHLYKFELIDSQGNRQLRTDPYALAYERAVEPAAIVWREDGYAWQDGGWMGRRRALRPFRECISIYEVHLDSWRRVPEENCRPLTYREIAPQLADYCNEMGFTHVEFLPLAEFPFDGSWGYQSTGYFAPTARYGSPDDFKFLVDTLHRASIGVIVDWVPAHFPRDRFALAQFDGTCLYEYADSRIGEHSQWGTLVFNYRRHEVANFLLCSALSWCDRYHVDGFRVDAVAAMIYRSYGRESGEWEPNVHGGPENLEAIDFLKNFNVAVHREFPGVLTIAEESTTFAGVTRPVDLGGLGFDFKWGMGWMHDTLDYFSQNPVFRRHCHNRLTFAMLYQYSEHFILALSHDEVVHGKGSLLARMPSDRMDWKCAMLRSLYGYMWAWPGKKSLFMGGEFGQHDEWCHFRSLDWHLLKYMNHSGLRRWVRDLNRLYRSLPWLGLYDDDPRGFRWIDPDDGDGGVLTFLRQGDSPGQLLLAACNFSGTPHRSYPVAVPVAGFWEEALNGDSLHYGGCGMGNCGGQWTEPVPSRGMEQRLLLHLPPHCCILLRPRKSSKSL